MNFILTPKFSLSSLVINVIVAEEFVYEPSLRPHFSITLLFWLTSVLNKVLFATIVWNLSFSES